MHQIRESNRSISALGRSLSSIFLKLLRIIGANRQGASTQMAEATRTASAA
jgi:hypothetical protein